MQHPPDLKRNGPATLARVLIGLASVIGLIAAYMVIVDVCQDMQRIDRSQDIDALAADFRAAMAPSFSVEGAQKWIDTETASKSWLKEAILLDTNDGGRIVAAYPGSAVGRRMGYNLVLVGSLGQQIYIQYSSELQGPPAEAYVPIDPDSGYIQRKVVDIVDEGGRRYVLMLSGAGLGFYESGSIPAYRVAAEILDGILRILLVCFWLLLAWWIYRDSRYRRMNALAWGVFGLMAGPVAWAIYRLVQPETSKCPACGAEHSVRTAFCTACGESLDLSCARCRQLMEEDWEYCGYCGAPADDGQSAPTE